jgi:hypothetical protein
MQSPRSEPCVRRSFLGRPRRERGARPSDQRRQGSTRLNPRQRCCSELLKRCRSHVRVVRYDRNRGPVADSKYGFSDPMEPGSVRGMPIGGSFSAAALRPEFNRHRLVQTTPALSGSGEYPTAQPGRSGMASSSKVEAGQRTKLISLSCRVKLESNCG